MVVIREFEHDGSKFEIKRALVEDVHQYQVFCNGRPVGGRSTASADTVSDAKIVGGDVDTIVADELEHAVKRVKVQVNDGKSYSGA